MRTFKNFPSNVKCPLCNTNKNTECTLLPIDGTTEGNNCEAIPVHINCIKNLELRYNKEANIVYSVCK